MVLESVGYVKILQSITILARENLSSETEFLTNVACSMLDVG